MRVYVFTTIVLVTVLSASAAAVISLMYRPRAGSSQAAVVDKLLQVAVLGAGAISAMMSGFAES